MADDGHYQGQHQAKHRGTPGAAQEDHQGEKNNESEPVHADGPDNAAAEASEQKMTGARLNQRQEEGDAAPGATRVSHRPLR